MNMDVIQQIKNLPQKTGVYIMKDQSGNVIYIGKAKNIRSRVSSYFSKKYSGIKNITLAHNTNKIDFITTDNEVEALILESNLIKKYKPRFNIELKDNQKYPFIKITNEKYPRIVKTRIKKDDSSLYFGPYPNVKYINRTIKTITDVFPIRRCSRSSDSGTMKSPCLNYHLGKCVCPFLESVSEEEYKHLVNQVVLFLKGQSDILLQELKKDMEKEAQKLKFEKAIRLREMYLAVKNITEEQKITSLKEENEDIIGIEEEDNLFSVVVFIKRNGKIVGKKDYQVSGGTSKQDVLEQFIHRYYEESNDIPSSILIPFQVPYLSAFREYLKKNYNQKVNITSPKKGVKKRLLNLATKNARDLLKEYLHRYNPSTSQEKLKKLLNLKESPLIIEGFDVATIMGDFSVGAVVRFYSGRPDKKNYRKFRIKYVPQQNDVEMIRETVARRYQRLINEKKPLPHLVLIDGGIPQVNGAAKIMEILGLGHIPLIGLAKREELIYIKGEKEPLRLERRNEALRLLMAIRNEAHRFANTYHIKIRAKQTLMSRLKEIPGVGEVTASNILRAVFDMKESFSLENLIKIKGVGKKRAEKVYRIFLKSGLSG